MHDQKQAQRICNNLAAMILSQAAQHRYRKLHVRELVAEFCVTHGLDSASEGGAMNYGVVIGDTFVIKVVHRGDDAWGFLKGVRDKTLRSKHYPKVYSFYQFDSERIVALAVIEKLTFPSMELREKLSDFVRDYSSHEPELTPKQPFIKQALNKIRYKTGLLGNDCHSGNIMQRADGTIVLVDPVA